MPDEDPKLDKNRYYTPPGVTEPILRPEFVEEEAAKAEPEAEPEKSAPAKKASTKTRSASKAARKK